MLGAPLPNDCIGKQNIGISMNTTMSVSSSVLKLNKKTLFRAAEGDAICYL